jgi:outer membrane protein assembly factor BamA
VLGLLFSLVVIGSEPDCARLPPSPDPVELDSASGQTLRCIDFEIDGAIRPEAIRRALRLGEGDTFDADVWRRDLQTLANLGFFRRLETDVLLLDDRGVALRLRVQTAWSLLPFLAYEGGAVPITIIGAYYANLFGQMVDAGAYYMRRGPYDLGRAWVSVPHWPWPRSLLDAQLVLTGELRAQYPGRLADAPPGTRQVYTDDSFGWRVPESGVEVMRRGGFVDFGFQPAPELLTLSLRYALLHETTVAIENLPEVALAELRDRERVAVERGRESAAWLSLVSATALVGQIDLVDNFQFRGHELRAVVLGSTDVLGSARDFAWLYMSYRGFTELHRDLDLALRLTAAHSTSDHANDDFVLGGHNLEPFVFNSKLPGLLSVRGVRPSTFHGRELAFANLEPRYTLLRDFDLWLAGGISLQLAAFIDVGRAWSGALEPRDDLALISGAGVLLTLLEFRYTYVNWYVARVFEPFPETVLNVVVTRPFF